MIIAKEEVLSLLEQAREIVGNNISIDLHVSPYEVIFNVFHYSPNPFEDGIMSVGPMRYQPPNVGPIADRENPPRPLGRSSQETAKNLSLFLYRRSFNHIGPRVLEDQMWLGGVKRCLLLPVLAPKSDGKAEMDFVNGMFGGDERFQLGYCVPNPIRNEAIGDDIQLAKEKYGIRAIKLNANITSIDLSTHQGRARVEAILNGCQLATLPLVIHAGRNPVVSDSSTRDFSSLRNLVEIDWSISQYPVILSHGGLMGAAHDEVKNEILPRLATIMKAYHNVRIDISALETFSLRLILEEIEIDKIVFGSDFPYFTQWGTVAKLLSALHAVCGRVDEPFLKIIVKNPARVLSGEK